MIEHLTTDLKIDNTTTRMGVGEVINGNFTPYQNMWIVMWHLVKG